MDQTSDNLHYGTVTGAPIGDPLPQPQHACPNCGYCPHCGRGGYPRYPYYPPNPPWYCGTVTYTGGHIGNYYLPDGRTN